MLGDRPRHVPEVCSRSCAVKAATILFLIFSRLCYKTVNHVNRAYTQAPEQPSLQTHQTSLRLLIVDLEGGVVLYHLKKLMCQCACFYIIYTRSSPFRVLLLDPLGQTFPISTLFFF